MSRKIDPIEWKETEEEIRQLYRAEKHVERRKRLVMPQEILPHYKLALVWLRRVAQGVA